MVIRVPPRYSDFYPRPPRGGRLAERNFKIALTDISIHALREEGDGTRRQMVRGQPNFYPRPPRGGRQGRKPGNNTVK